VGVYAHAQVTAQTSRTRAPGDDSGARLAAHERTKGKERTVETTIDYNGSRWSGQSTATLEELYLVLAEHPLTARSGAKRTETGAMVFHGNFEDVSHAFSVTTDDPTVGAKLARLMYENRAHPPKGQRGSRLECPCLRAHFGVTP